MSGNVLVTGGAGFIGSHLCARLLGANHRVICIDNLNDFYAPAIKKLNLKTLERYKRFTFHQGDIRDRQFIAEVFAEHRIGAVIHLAAMAGVRPSIEQPLLYTDNNVVGTQCMLEAAVNNKVDHFVFASSSSVYGNNVKTPFSEEDRVDFQVSPYGGTKKSGELLCYTYHHLYGLPVSCLRFFTVYGPRQRPEMAIHKFVRKIFNGEPIPLYGDGGTARDYTYISDIITGITACLDTPNDYIIYNLGNSDPIKILELITTISDITGMEAKIENLPLPPGDVLQTFANIERARTRLGFDPQVDIKAGITEFVKWYRKMRNEHGDLFR